MLLLDKEALRERIEKRVFSDISEGKICGAAVKVMQKGEVLYEGYLGSNTPDGTKPLAKNTLFRLASMTKPITAVATLIQLQRGKLSLEDEVAKYLPEYKDIEVGALDENGNVFSLGKSTTPLKIIHLLTHSSGMEFGEIYTKQITDITPDDKSTLEKFVKYHSKIKLGYTPFTAQSYSGVVAFDVMARIIEITSGMTFDEFLEKEIFNPLGMKDTTFTPTEEQWSRIITIHNRVDGKSVEGNFKKGCIFADYPTTHFLGGAGLISSLEDYSVFAEFLLNKGTYKGVKILDSKYIDMMSTPYVPENIMDYFCRWGLGVRVITREESPLPIDCFGWSGAYGCHFWVDPKNEITAIYMKNSLYDGGSGAVTASNFEKDVYGK